MVTHSRNSGSAFNPSQVHTHTRSSGQPFMLRHPGSSRGFGALLKATSVVVLRALYIHSPHLQFLPDRDSNPQPFDYESDSLTIRPRLPLMLELGCISQKHHNVNRSLPPIFSKKSAFYLLSVDKTINQLFLKS